MSNHFFKLVKLALFITLVCTTWLLGAELFYLAGIGLAVLYTVSFTAGLILAVSIWIDMNGR